MATYTATTTAASAFNREAAQFGPVIDASSEVILDAPVSEDVSDTAPTDTPGSVVLSNSSLLDFHAVP